MLPALHNTTSCLQQSSLPLYFLQAPSSTCEANKQEELERDRALLLDKSCPLDWKGAGCDVALEFSLLSLVTQSLLIFRTEADHKCAMEWPSQPKIIPVIQCGIRYCAAAAASAHTRCQRHAHTCLVKPCAECTTLFNCRVSLQSCVYLQSLGQQRRCRIHSPH